MTKFLFAIAAVVLSTAAALAEDQPTTGTPTTSPAPVIVTSGPVVEYTPAQTTRRGLFGRLRNRNATPTYGTPYSGPIVTTPVMGATPMPPVAPQVMPGIKPAGGAMMMTPGMVVQATGNLPPGTYTTTDGTIVQIGGMQPMMQSTSMSSPTTRRGLFGRLRDR